jgi:hypothetical protein
VECKFAGLTADGIWSVPTSPTPDRLRPPRDAGRTWVATTSFDTDWAALNSFYCFAAARYGIANPVPRVLSAVDAYLDPGEGSRRVAGGGLPGAAGRRLRPAARAAGRDRL